MEPHKNPSQLALKLGALLKLGGRAERGAHPALSSENRKHVSGEELEIMRLIFYSTLKSANLDLVKVTKNVCNFYVRYF